MWVLLYFLTLTIEILCHNFITPHLLHFKELVKIIFGNCNVYKFYVFYW